MFFKNLDSSDSSVLLDHTHCHFEDILEQPHRYRNLVHLSSVGVSELEDLPSYLDVFSEKGKIRYFLEILSLAYTLEWQQ